MPPPWRARRRGSSSPHRAAESRPLGSGRVFLTIGGILEPAVLEAIREKLADAALFEDGRRTAGWHAREVKRNLQTRGGIADDVTERVQAALEGHPVFR